MRGCLSPGPHWGPGLQPRHVPRLGIQLVTLWFAAHTQSTELHQPGLVAFFNISVIVSIHISSTLNTFLLTPRLQQYFLSSFSPSNFFQSNFMKC